MRNLLVTMAYDGKHFHGWQIQDNAISVQEVFQNALKKVIGTVPDIKGCSRTDSGVHANMYCVSFKTDHTIPCERLTAALNRFLPPSAAVMKVEEKPEDFHARYDCKGKEYIYRIWNNEIRNPFMDGYVLHYWYKIDEQKLDRAAKHFLGRHDFTSFCTVDKHRRKGDFHRTVKNIAVTRDGDMVTIRIEADGFLYNMVRIIVGTLLSVAQGKTEPEDIDVILSALDRSKAGPTAPPQGLYLNKVIYGP